MEPSTPGTKPSAREKLKRLFEEYGLVAIGVFVVIWVLVLGGLYLAVKFGWKPESAAGEAGTFGVAYIAFRFTLPLRIGATVVLTPVVARVLERFKLRKPQT
ncbi:MAG: DUF1279 domain-containing protein [Myxococcaceae bacterium]|nr:DUF1279 domain-containing protein [Myxococcaceae bacterium]